MGRFVEGADRSQLTLLPDCLEDWVDENNAVYVIDAFVEALDLHGLGFERTIAKETGRPSYHPSVLLKLYIYGYLNRVQSSRRLEREAGRNVEVMWLTGRLAPDHKTIADFRKDNGAAIRKVCAKFVALCRQMGLLQTPSVAIDGSKFKAVNNRDRNFTQAKMAKRMAQIEESVGRYLSQLDSADRQPSSDAMEIKTMRLKEKLVRLKQEMSRLQALDKQMREAPDQQISLTDPDARSMAVGGRGSGGAAFRLCATRCPPRRHERRCVATGVAQCVQRRPAVCLLERSARTRYRLPIAGAGVRRSQPRDREVAAIFSQARCRATPASKGRIGHRPRAQGRIA